MVSVDTNILFAAVHASASGHELAHDFLGHWSASDQMVISELVLAELYCLLRNAAVVTPPLAAAGAASVCQAFRRHPRWQVLGLPAESRRMHDDLWRHAAQHQFKRTRIYDARLALSLIAQGVSEFATVNTRDFQGFGFTKVWNPLLHQS